MQNQKSKVFLRCLNIVLSVIVVVLTGVIYLWGLRVIIPSESDYPHRYLYLYFRGLSFLIVLGFDVVWIILMRLWPLKNTKLKIVLTLVIFTLSAIVLTDLLIIHAFQNMW